MRIKFVATERYEEGKEVAGRMRTLLRNAGIELVDSEARADGIVSYGVSGVYSSKPILNRNVLKYDKIEAFRKFEERGLWAPRVYYSTDYIRSFPVIGRSRNHTGGHDMVRYNDYVEIRNRRKDHDAYVEFIPSIAEWRCWVYKNEILGIYEKVVLEAWRTRYSPGRNCDFGWGFATRQLYEAPEDIKDIAITATKALELDFGAVDMLIIDNGSVCTLEVNTAPGFETLKHGGANGLVRKIKEGSWLCQAR